VVLVRHAATAWSGRRYCGRSDPPLDQAGIASAARAAAELRPRLRPGTRIVASPRRRAIQTATEIARVIAARSVDIDERWAETDFGIAEGLTFDELTLVAPDIAARLSSGDTEIDWPGGEAAATLVERVVAAWRDAISYQAGSLVVTHGGPIRVAIAHATDRRAADVVVPGPAGSLLVSQEGTGRGWSVLEYP
jgi:broad specificity phosphatase PhoE